MTAGKINRLGFDHARYGTDPLTPDQLRGVINTLMLYTTVTERFPELHTAYTQGYLEWEGKR